MGGPLGRPESLGSEPEGGLLSQTRPGDRRGEQAGAGESTGAESRALLPATAPGSRPDAGCGGGSRGLRLGGRTRAQGAGPGGAGPEWSLQSFDPLQPCLWPGRPPALSFCFPLSLGTRGAEHHRQVPFPNDSRPGGGTAAVARSTAESR